MEVIKRFGDKVLARDVFAPRWPCLQSRLAIQPRARRTPTARRPSPRPLFSKRRLRQRHHLQDLNELCYRAAATLSHARGARVSRSRSTRWVTSRATATDPRTTPLG